MKKVMLLAMMAAVTMTVSAQEEAFKNAKKLFDKGSVDEAIQAVQPALTAGTDEDKAAAWNLLSAAQYKKFSDIQAKKIENQVKQSNEPVDEAAMNAAAIAALEAAMKCDEFDSKPNEKGKVKLKYRGENQKIYQNGRLQAINAGQYLYNQKDYKGAFKAFAIYVDSGESPLFTGIDMSQDQYKHEVAYFASLAAYQEKDYENVIKYAQIVKQHRYLLCGEITRTACRVRGNAFCRQNLLKGFIPSLCASQEYCYVGISYRSCPVPVFFGRIVYSLLFHKALYPCGCCLRFQLPFGNTGLF